MPFITYEGPQIRPMEKRRQLVQGSTSLVAELLEIPQGDVVVLIKEQGGPHMTKTPEAISVGGRILREPTSP